MEWLLFGASVFFFMGLALAFDAEHHAQAASDWERLALGMPEAKSRRPRAPLVRAYRAGGAAFCVLGLWLALARPSFLPFKASAENRLAGFALIAAAAAMGWLKLSEWTSPSRLPAALEEALLGAVEQGKSWQRRVSFWSGWLVVANVLFFGLYLASRP